VFPPGFTAGDFGFATTAHCPAGGASATKAHSSGQSLLLHVARVLPPTSAAGPDRLGKNDGIFTVEGARLYTKDLKKAEFHLLDTEHFALEEDLDEIAALIRDFLNRHGARR
jgi:hypothetical protein